MYPPTVPENWQGFAQPSRRAAKFVVTVARSGEDFPCVGGLIQRHHRHDCTPSDLIRPVPLWGRSGLFSARRDARTLADRVHSALELNAFLFQDMSRTVELAVTTTQRGIEPCVNILSFLPLRPQHSPGACPPRPSAAWPAPSPVRPSPTRRMKTWSRARPSAHLQVPHPAACRACRPAAATDLIAARARPDDYRIGPSGHLAPVALVISASRPGCGGRGERCSRKS